MKKFLIVLVVLTMVCLSSMAFAADVSVGGSVQVRSRNFEALGFDKDNANGSQVDTQTRVELDVNVKASDDVKGKIAIWNDFTSWGTLEQNVSTKGQTPTAVDESYNATNKVDNFGFREAWINFNLPGIPVNVTAGHQLLALGQGWFFRSKHYGSDAWVVANVTGNNTVAFVDVKASEGTSGIAGDDVDAYVLLDVYKIDDNNVIGIDITDVNGRHALAGADANGVRPHLELQNISLNYTGKLGPVGLKAQVDAQMGKVESTSLEPESKFKGYEGVVQGKIAASDMFGINFTLAYGSGNKSDSNDTDAYQTILDIDPHYTFLYEYKTITAAGQLHTGFSNTMAASVGVTAALSKSLNIGLDYWYLQATEKASTPAGLSGAGDSSDVGSEIDLAVNWKLYDNLTWNWVAGYYKPGDAMKIGPDGKTDAVMGIQGILALNF